MVVLVVRIKMFVMVVMMVIMAILVAVRMMMVMVGMVLVRRILALTVIGNNDVGNGSGWDSYNDM